MKRIRGNRIWRAAVSLMLVCVMVFGVLNVPAYAATTTVASGICGENVN